MCDRCEILEERARMWRSRATAAKKSLRDERRELELLRKLVRDLTREDAA